MDALWDSVAPLAKYLGIALLVVGVYTLAFLDYAAKGPTKRQRKQQRRADKQAGAYIRPLLFSSKLSA
jgi:hypothetical protein